MVVQKIESH